MIDAIITNSASPTLDNPKKSKSSSTSAGEAFQGILAALVIPPANQTVAETQVLDSPQAEQLALASHSSHILAMPYDIVDLQSDENTLDAVTEQPFGLMINDNIQNEHKTSQYTENALIDSASLVNERRQSLQTADESAVINTTMQENVTPELKGIPALYSIDRAINNNTDKATALNTKVLQRDLQEVILGNSARRSDARTEMQPISPFQLKAVLNSFKNTDADSSFDSEYTAKGLEAEGTDQTDLTDEKFKHLYSSYSINVGRTADSYENFSKDSIILDTEGSFVQELLDTVNYSLKENRSELEIQLKPEHLGKLVLKVSMDEGVLAARLTVESSNMKDFLNSHLKELRSALSNQGLSLSYLDVDVGSRQSFSNERYQQGLMGTLIPHKQSASATGDETSFKTFDNPFAKNSFNAFV